MTKTKAIRTSSEQTFSFSARRVPARLLRENSLPYTVPALNEGKDTAMRLKVKVCRVET